MLSRSLDTDTEIVPGTLGKYTLAKTGVLKDTIKGSLIPIEFSEYDEPEAVIDFGFGAVKMKIAVLLAIRHKRLQLPQRHWPYLDVKYIDGDPTNFDPENVVWKFPQEGLKLDVSSDFRFIPGFSRYMINREGVVYSTCNGSNLSPYKDASGYWMYGVTPDVGKRTIVGMHRLLALAFLPYPACVDTLDVNHLDGDKANNAIGNLEWANRKRNCDHAYSTGLRTDNMAVLVRNMYSGEVKEFYSIEEGARKLKLDGETLRIRLKADKSNVYYPGFQLRLKSDTTPWIEHNDLFVAIRDTGSGIPLMVANLITGELTTHYGHASVAKVLGVSTAAISYFFRNYAREKFFKNYRIFYPDFKRLSLSYFAEM